MAKSVDFTDLYNRAHNAGLVAAQNAQVVPMIVQSVNPLTGVPIAGAKTHFVADGVCGFAWISFKGNTPFGRWAKKVNVARNGYPSGLQISVSYYNQSLQLKEAYADAFAQVLRDAGVEAYSQSRMD